MRFRLLCRALQADARKSSRLPRFYHSPLPATKGLRAKLGSAESKHAARVLRLQEGDLIELCDGEGRTVHVRLVSTDKTGCLLEAVADVALAPWVGPRWEVRGGEGGGCRVGCAPATPSQCLTAAVGFRVRATT